jgi:hypothetical protein
MRSQNRETAGSAGADQGTQDSSEGPWKPEWQFRLRKSRFSVGAEPGKGRKNGTLIYADLADLRG